MHLLGIRNGHWFDKLRREWQMYRSFQTAMTLLRPDAVFFLGDVFDEGQWSSEKELQMYAKRFDSLFYVDSKVKRFVVVGNHDVGFHYAIRPDNLERFSEHFGMSKTVEHFTLNGNHFVAINSMAMERDGCRLCGEAEKDVAKLGKQFSCTLKFDDKICSKKFDSPYSRPVLLQHFPLYRESDEICEAFPDLTPDDLIREKFREKWECLSQESTEFLLNQLNPRAAFGGHTHFGCRKRWSSFYEYTVPSFSWRNNRHPSFILLSISPEAIYVDTCRLPHENTVILLYVLFGSCWLLYIMYLIVMQFHLKKRSFSRVFSFYKSASKQV